MPRAHATNRKKVKENDDGMLAPPPVTEELPGRFSGASQSLGKSVNALVDVLKPKPVALPGRGRGMDDAHGLPTDTRSPARLGFRVIAIGFGGFLLWAALAPLDEGVPTSGVVTIDTKRKAVQHLTGGIVKAVHVKEGLIVAEGAPLMEIDPASTQANFEGVRQRYYTLRATEARLVAEQAGRESIRFHPHLLEEKDSPLVVDLIANQEGLFSARKMALEAEIQAIEESAAGLEGSIAGYQGLLESRRSQLDFLKEEIKGLSELVKDGYAPRNNLLALQRTQAETIGSIADLQGNIERSKSALAEAKLRITQRKQEFRKEVDRELADVRGQVDGEGERFIALKGDLARTVIRAPASGQVVGLSVQTVGGVIGPGQKIMDIVPQDEPLLLETHIPPHLIDRVRPGLETDVRFSSFAHSPLLVVPGEVVSVSHDLLINEQTGAPYYLARVSVTEDGMKKLGRRQLQAGMPVEVVVITGERTMLTYLLHPLLKRLASSMKEE
ncbi:MAG: HlyD family type I secretion periplasmic adaptor subunit [Azoarcus sp.]|jgi:protease secretion system membrane fusion protein|nr:HlyD family type I secretion periplasmic adaptor subunit [Azoarcus sp.]